MRETAYLSPARGIDNNFGLYTKLSKGYVTPFQPHPIYLIIFRRDLNKGSSQSGGSGGWQFSNYSLDNLVNKLRALLQSTHAIAHLQLLESNSEFGTPTNGHWRQQPGDNVYGLSHIQYTIHRQHPHGNTTKV